MPHGHPSMHAAGYTDTHEQQRHRQHPHRQQAFALDADRSPPQHPFLHRARLRLRSTKARNTT
eukprot:7504590-Pyramimonas_sp.AAC.1